MLCVAPATGERLLLCGSGTLTPPLVVAVERNVQRSSSSSSSAAAAAAGAAASAAAAAGAGDTHARTHPKWRGPRAHTHPNWQGPCAEGA
eukprot:gene18673-biopygen14502